MIQRGLAILLSVCMLAGGISDTSYAMSQQENGTIFAEQNASETGEISELLLEEAAEESEKANEEKLQEDQAESGGVSNENDSVGSETGNRSDIVESKTGDESGSAGSETEDENDIKEENGVASGDGIDENGNNIADGDDTAGSGTGDESGITGSENGEKDDTAGSEFGDEGDDPENENDIDTDVAEEDAIESVTEETEEENGISTLMYYKEEELRLTIGTPQTVTLENEEEQQWLSFTAPKAGLYRFYSESEGDNRWKWVGIYHRKFGNPLDWAEDGENYNFTYSYYMQAKEKIYLLVGGYPGTFTVNVDKVEIQEPEKLTVTKNDEGNYTLLSDNYQLNIVLTPSYTKMKMEMELLQADGNVLPDDNPYQVYFEYSIIRGDKSDLCDYFGGSKYEDEFEYLRPGREFTITNVIIRDKEDSQNIFAALSENGQKITINTIMTDQKGYITEVTAEDTSITVGVEIISGTQLLRYRKETEEEWSYYEYEIYYDESEITFAADPDTEYLIELVSKDRNTVYDKIKIRTEKFAVSNIEVKVTSIKSSSAVIQISIGEYTGNKQYICARVSYTDSTGKLQTRSDCIDSKNINDNSINLSLDNLVAETEYKDLEIEIDDSDSGSMKYAAYRTKVSFTTKPSVLTGDQIDVTVTPDAEDYSKAVMNVALKEVTGGAYYYKGQYRIKGRKDWEDLNINSVYLGSSNSYTNEQNMTSLIGNTMYELRVIVDGISKTINFTTTSAKISADVNVEPLTAGVRVTAELTGADESDGKYQINVAYYNQKDCRWKSAYSGKNYNDIYLTADKNWKTTVIFYGTNLRFNAENDWRVSINKSWSEKVYEKYFTLQAPEQEISLAAQNIKITQAQVRVDYKTEDSTSVYAKSGNINYRVKGTSKWIEAVYDEDEDLFYLYGLKEETDYEVKFVKSDYLDDIVAQTSFRTPKETRSLSATLDDYSYTSAQVSWSYENGEFESPSYVCLNYREKGSWKWKNLESGWKDASESGKCVLENLEPGKTYEVVAELKESDGYYYDWWYYKYEVNEGTVMNQKIEFTTKAVDYVLTVDNKEEEQTTVSFQLQLSNPAGNLDKDARATVILQSVSENSIGESVSGNSISEETVDLNQKNQYNATAKVGGLLPNTKYTVKAKLFGSEENVWVLLKNFMFGEVTTKEAKAPTSLALEEKEIVLGKGMKKKLTVKVEPQEAAAGLAWTSSDETVATVDEDGTVTALKAGETDITVSSMAADSGGLSDVCHVTVKDYGYDFSITKPETDNDSYRAVETADAVYQVAAGETYQVGCVLLSADANLDILPANQFNWTADHEAVTCVPSENGKAEIKIPENVSGAVKITAAMKDEEYKEKSYTVTLDVLKKPDVEVVPATYMWLDYSNRLADAGLPEDWQWEEENALVYETGQKNFAACYEKSGYYPYKTIVTVHAETVDDILSVDNGSYSEDKKAYIVKKAEPLRVSVKGQSIPDILYEQTSLLPDSKDASKVKVSGPDQGYYSVTADVKGTYTVSVITSLKKAAFKIENGSYHLVSGDKVKDVESSLQFMVVDNTSIIGITFKLAEDSPEKVSITEDNAIEYRITAENAEEKNRERKIILKVSVTDADGREVQNPNINYTVSDTAVVKLKKEGTDRLVLTIPKGADGLAKIVATAKDEFGFKQGLSVRVKDYTPRVTVYKATINKNYNEYVTIAQAVLPYVGSGDDRIETIKLVETNDRNANEAAGLGVETNSLSGGQKFDIGLKVTDKNKNWKKGTLKYYLAVTTKVYGAPVFFPVQIKMETSIPNVAVKQTNKANVFYKDTTHLEEYDAVSMGLLEFTSQAWIESVVWRPNGGAENVPASNTEFVIKDENSVFKNGKYTNKYRICQNNPNLNSSNKKPVESAVKGKLYIHLAGYNEAIEKELTIQTVYKKPVLKMGGDYKVCPALGYNNISLPVYTNAAKQNNSLVQAGKEDKEYIPVWRGYSGISCADQGLKVEPDGNLVMVSYSGTGDRKTQFTFNSDYWYEPLTAAVKVKVVSSKVKLTPASVTLNTTYSSDTAQTAAMVRICNAAAGYGINISSIEAEGANAKSKQLLTQNLIKINKDIDYGSGDIVISLNDVKAAGSGSVAPGSYKFKLTPSYGNTELNTVTLNVKVIDKNAEVTVKAKGTIDLLKLEPYGGGYSEEYNYITVTPSFKNLNSCFDSYEIYDVELNGEYKDLFMISDWDSDGCLKIQPRSTGKLKAGENYKLSVSYQIENGYGEGGKMITLKSNDFSVKPKQSVPKVTLSQKQLTLYASADGEENAETMYLYVPYSNYKTGYYVIQSADGSLDVNKDGIADLVVTTEDILWYNGGAQINVYISDADAIKATAKGVTYKIPVTVRCEGRDGVSRDAVTTVSVVVKK